MEAKVRALMAKVNKKHGPGTIVLGADMLSTPLPRMTSGVLSLDVALGGGWVANQWIEVIGNESSGKTLLLGETIAANQARDPKWLALWIGAEFFVAPYFQMLGCDMDRIIVVNERTMETVYETVLTFLEDRAVDCVVIDSLPALIPSRVEDTDMEDHDVNVALAARINSFFLNKANAAQRRSLVEPDRPCLAFIINQWRQRVGARYGDPRTSPGGSVKNFVCFLIVDVAREEFINNSRNEPVGQRIRVRNRKNKTAPPGRIATFDVYLTDYHEFSAGEIDLVKDVYDVALSYGVITRPSSRSGKPGSVYLVSGQRYRGKDAVIEALRTDAALMEQVHKEVLALTAGTDLTPTRARRKARQDGSAQARQSRSRTTSGQADGGPAPRRKRQRAQAQ